MTKKVHGLTTYKMAQSVEWTKKNGSAEFIADCDPGKPIVRGNYHESTDLSRLEENINMSDSGSDSDFSRSYSSDGEIPCSHTKQYDFNLEIGDILKFDDAESFACFPDEEEIRRSGTSNLKKINGDYMVIPSSVRNILNKSIMKRIKSLRMTQKTVVYIKLPLLAFMTEDLPAPRNVVCDAFIFSSSGPVTVLTFVTEDSDSAMNYNSTLARQLTVAVRRETGSDFYPVHGTVGENIYESQELFEEIMIELKENATKIAIPFSMNIGEDLLRKVLQMFGQLFTNLKLSSFQSELFNRFVKTSAYKEVNELLVQYKLLILTGAPGEGKSTIGKKLCYDYQQRGINTVFYNSQQDFDLAAMKEMKQTLVVCDNVEDYVDLRRLKKIINTCTVVIIMQTHDMRLSLGNEGITVNVVDITDIRRQTGSPKDEFLQILKVSLGNTQECILKDIVDNAPQWVGFPKVISHYQKHNWSNNPVSYFKYPLSFFQSEIEKISKKSKLECFLYLLLCGGRMKESSKAEQKRALRVLQSKFTYIWEEYVVDRLRCFIGSFFDEDDDTVYFSHQVIYDACLIVLDANFPGFIWKHCQVQFEIEESLPTFEPLTIFISKHNNDLLLNKIVKEIQKGQIKDTLAHGILRNKANVDTFLTELADHFHEIVHVTDHKETFLFWVVESFNEYLCNRILERKEITQQDINYVLRHLTASKRRKSFLFIREQLKNMQRKDVCYSAEIQDEDGNSLLMRAMEQKNYELADTLINDSNKFVIKNKKGNTPLHISIHTGNLKLTKCLLSKLDVNGKSMKGEHLRTPIMIAALRNQNEIFRILADEELCDLKGVDEHGDTLLHLACVGGNVNIVDRLFNSNEFDLKQRDHYGRTLLMTSALLAKRDLFMWLLEHKCHISSHDFDISDLLSPGHVEHFRTITKFLQVRSYGIPDRYFIVSKTTKENTLKTYLDGKLPSMKLVDESLLHQAAKSGHLKLAELLISKGKVDINTTDAAGQTPVMLAAKDGKKEMFDFLVNKKCDLSLTDYKGSTIIHFACCGGNMAILKKLIDFKTDLNSMNKLGEAPISLAIKHENEDMVLTLTVEGCDLSVVDHDRNTLLHLASKSGNTTILEHLLFMKMGMCLNALNIDRQTPLLAATYDGHTELSLRLISEGAHIDVKDHEDNDVLLVAAKKGNEKLFKYVLDQLLSVSHTEFTEEDTTSDTVDIGHQSLVQQQIIAAFNIEDSDTRGNTILHAACFGGNITIVSLLLDLKPDIEMKTGMGKTAVMIAAERGHKDAFDLLVINGCNLTGTDKSKRTILHSACIGGSIDIVKYILKEEIVDQNSSDSNEGTPLMTTAERGHEDVFSLLIKTGCNYSLVDDVSHNVLHIACKGGSSSIVHHILQEEMVDVDLADQQGKTAIFMAAETGNKDIFNILLENGGDLKVMDEDGNTILHAACRGGNTDIVQLILLHDICDINSKSFRNKTPVMDAAEKGHAAVFWLLKDKDCTLTTVAGDKSTILHAASSGGCKEIVQMLLTSKIADINSRDSKGRTPVIEAADKGHKAVYDVLVKEGCDLTLSSLDNYNILHAACHGGSMAIVRSLLSREVADINSKWYGTTPAGMARLYRHHAISELLQDVCLS